MVITTSQITGDGRGKFLGFPTINMQVPRNLVLEQGIYAVWVRCSQKRYLGAMHFGPVPTFQNPQIRLEVFLLHVTQQEAEQLDTKSIQIETIQRIREVKSFSSKEALIAQMTLDVAAIDRIGSQVFPG